MKRLATALLVGLLAGCAPPGSEPSSELKHALVPDLSGGIEGPAWSGSGEASSSVDVVGTVNGAPVGRAEVERLLDAHPELSAEEALETLVVTELLAQARFSAAASQGEDVYRPWREALAQRYLRETFEAQTSPETIPLKEVERIYWLPSIRKQYDHADAWQMAHLFFTCCDPKVESCDNAEVMACFADAGQMIQEVYEEVKSRTEPVEGDAQAVVDLMKAYRLEMENELPQLAFRERPFFYDPKQPHSEQKGYNLLAEAVARTVTNAPHAVIQEPVQSPFGWHILVQLKHEPESRRGVDDPEVVADIRSKLLPRYRRSMFARHVEELRARYDVNIEEAALRLLGGGGAAASPTAAQ